MDTEAIMVAGKPEPMPRGAIARKKTIAPKHAIRNIQPLSNMPMAINPCPNAISLTITLICDLNHPFIKSA